MIELKIEGKIYQMPNSWEEVTLKKYIEIQSVEEDGAKQLIAYISILSGCPLKTLLQVSLDSLSNFDMSWLNKPMSEGVEMILVIDGKKYGLIKDMKKISLGEYVDLDYYTLGESHKNLHYILAIMMRPVILEDGELYIIEKYDSEKLEDRAKIFFEFMNMKQLHNCSHFFSNSANGFIQNLKSFSI